ncbi:MAG: hypothetical protein FJZ90_09655, partial [Chloroflexi bacterium]|nr:hypothetical protein [Chloroflexota bacterium]
MRRIHVIILLLLTVTLFGGASMSASPRNPAADAAPLPADQAGQQLGRIPAGQPQVVPILYRFFDFGNDWQTLAPQWGPVGSVHWCLWEEINPAEGVYDWRVVDQRLAQEAGLKVTLPDGTVIPKPVVIQVHTHLSGARDWPDVYFYDGTPEWVYDKIEQDDP